MNKLFFVSLILFLPIFFANNVLADDEPTQEEKERVDLLRVRDIIIRSFSVEKLSTSTKTLEASIEAAFDQAEMTIFVDNYYGEVVISISGQTTSSDLTESFYVNGSSECNVDISSLQPGDYTIEIETANGSFVGKFVIEN